MGLPDLPSDGWRVVAGSLPPSRDEHHPPGTRVAYPECVIAAPWPAVAPSWVWVEIGRQVVSPDHVDPTRYGEAERFPTTALGNRWNCSVFIGPLRAGRTRRRGGLAMAFVRAGLHIAVGESPDVRVRLIDDGQRPWLNRAPRWEHDMDGVLGSVVDEGGVALSDRWPDGACVEVNRLPDLRLGESVDLPVTFMGVGPRELPPGRYVLRAELTSLHLVADGLPLTVT